MWQKSASWLLIGSLGIVAPMTGCESLPGNKKQQGAVIGGAGGAAAGAAIAKDNRLAGALIGGLLGAGGGYLVGANMDKHGSDDDKSKQEAQQAAEKAKASPATAEQVNTATTADLNNDGFVTLDEVVAMEKAHLSNPEMIKRLRSTQQYFQLTSDQEQYLRDNGVDQKVIDAMRDMKPTDGARTASEKSSASDVDMRTNPRFD
jgi:hypothetical protein